MKKLIALLLCGIITISTLAGCGNNESKNPEDDKQSENQDDQKDPEEGGEKDSEEGDGEDQYAENIEFSIANHFSQYKINAGIDYESDEFFQWICEKFNVTMDLWANEDSGASEKTSMWINNGEMPDTMWTDRVGLSTYYDYVDQGLLKALPDDWETRWPDLAAMVEKTSIKDAIVVDGKTYMIPHAMVGQFADVDHFTYTTTVFLRQDFAEQVGMSEIGSDGSVTVSELRSYLEACQEAELAPVGLEGSDYWFVRWVTAAYNVPDYSVKIIKDADGNYVNAGEYLKDNYIAMLTEMQDWYKNGLLDPDYYTKNDAASISNFGVGNAAAVVYSYMPGDIKYIYDVYAEGTGNNAEEDVKCVVLVNDDGSITQTEGANYWGCQIFSPDCSDETMERFLDIMNWLCTEEGGVSQYLGIPEVDWKYETDGSIVSITNKMQVPTNIPFAHTGWSQCEFQYTGLDTSYPESIVETSIKTLAAATSGEIFPTLLEYDLHQSDAKKAFSMDTYNKIKEIICTDVDVEEAWNSFLEEVKITSDPLIEELNETYN